MRVLLVASICLDILAHASRVRVRSRELQDDNRYRATSLSAESLFETIRRDWNVQEPKIKVRRGLFVVKKGERVAVWHRNGAFTAVDGPRTVWLGFFGKIIQPLLKFVAGPDEFINVLRSDGAKEVIPGPAYLWQDPVDQQSVSVHRAMHINTNEALVVYQETAGKVSRRVVRGPAIFIPQASNEWIQQFVWHGIDPDFQKHGINRKVQGGLCFTKLRLIPDQLYFDVEKVRTKDDALLMVKTMIFFQLDDIERMVDNTHDAVSELINAISADVIEKASMLTFDQFRAATAEFNSLEAYPQLLEKAGSIGYRISKVIFRGYEASDTLQAMHDNAIESRTKLRLDTEREEQEQGLKNFRQSKELERALKMRDEEERVTQHATKMQSLKQEQQLLLQQKKDEQRMMMQGKQVEQELEKRNREFKILEEHYVALQKMGVDLTKHLLAEKPNHIVRFEQGKGSTASTDGQVAVQYHMYEPGSSS